MSNCLPHHHGSNEPICELLAPPFKSYKGSKCVNTGARTFLSSDLSNLNHMPKLYNWVHSTCNNTRRINQTSWGHLLACVGENPLQDLHTKHMYIWRVCYTWRGRVLKDWLMSQQRFARVGRRAMVSQFRKSGMWPWMSCKIRGWEIV